MNEFKATWYTIPEFLSVRPCNMYHKEQEENPAPTCAIENLHVLARASLHLDAADLKRILQISADDYYKLYINGRFVAQGPAPAYVERYYYNSIDITPYLHEGENVIAVHLYYQGLLNRVWNSRDGRFGLAAKLMDSQSGQSEELRWKYQVSKAYSGGTVGYETQFLEDFDSRLWNEDWNRAGFCEEGWMPMVPAPWADYSFEQQPVKQLETYFVESKAMTANREGLFVDFGQEITGALQLTACGKPGDIIVIRCGEECNPDGSVRYEMRCNCTYEERWTLGTGTCTLEQYDYKAFRYVQLLFGEGITVQKVSAAVRHYPLPDTLCTIKTDDAWLDQIFQLCKNTVKYGTQEGYLDCPSREKGQYLGDSVVTANAQVWLSGSVEMLRKCIDQFAQTRCICPGLMGVAPGSFMQEIADFSLLWSQLLLQDYRFTGDKEFLRTYYPVARELIRHFTRYAREDGLLVQVADKWNLVDWPENLRDDYDFELSRPVVAPGCHNVINALYVGAVKTLSEIEEILGLSSEQDWKKLKAAYIRTFYRPSTGLFADSQTSNHSALHSQIYALYFRLVPEGAEDGIVDFMLKKGFCCGVFASYFYLKGLAGAGRYEDVYRMLVNETEHGWINMLREGATTCYEAWGKEQKWNTSLCHPWASAPIPVIIEEIAGFMPDPSQKEGFRFEPHIPEWIQDFRLQVPFGGRTYQISKEHPATCAVLKRMI